MSKSAYSTPQTDNQNRPQIPKRKNKIRIFANVKNHCACQTLRTTCAELYTHKNRQSQLLSLEFVPKLKQQQVKPRRNRSINAAFVNRDAAGWRNKAMATWEP
ncbi:hypothetical protein Zmor_023564 [Zophobas morio]|uniref:Uncharacterized protein n=1 Tax=Zophobas morio TaxID=2755281 RepID=A0AA38HZG0_9CUCU|nr:hypothetical protein Zmor_023564 [Zophobas morio]